MVKSWQAYARDNRGLTLIELMVAITIAVIVLAPVLELLLTGNKMQVKAFGQVDLQEQAQKVLNQLVEGKVSNSVRVGGLRQALASRITVDTGKGLAFVTTGNNANYYVKTYYIKDDKIFYLEEERAQLPDKPSSVTASGGTPILDKVESFQIEEIINSQNGKKLYKISIKAGTTLNSGGRNEAVLSRVVMPRNP